MCKVISFKKRDVCPPKLLPLAFDGKKPKGPITERDILVKIRDGVSLWCLPRLDEAVQLHEKGVSGAWMSVELVRQYLQNMVNSLNQLEE